MDRAAEIILIEAWIAEHGVNRCPTACVVPVPHVFEPLLIAQRIAALKLPPSQRPSWLVLWLARMHEERQAYQAGMSVKQFRGRGGIVDSRRVGSLQDARKPLMGAAPGFPAIDGALLAAVGIREGHGGPPR